jgi:hypothetical protein
MFWYTLKIELNDRKISSRPLPASFYTVYACEEVTGAVNEACLVARMQNTSVV